MTHQLGLHWIKQHQTQRDLDHVAAMQYPSVKLFEHHWNNRDACRDLLAVLPKDAYILARDHPLSEQKADMWHDPAGTGTRHANEWAMKVASGNVHVPVERTFFLGINEPDATNGDRNAIDIYTASFLDRLHIHGLRGGAFNFSTGHPRTIDGTGNTQADYTVFERSHQAIVRGNHIGVLHIYGGFGRPCIPGHYDRLRACPWQDVEWIVGEAGLDQHALTGGGHQGYQAFFGDNLAGYCAWLDELIMGVNDPRIHSYQVFTYDFSHPWSSFDIKPIRDALESYPWQHKRPAKSHTTHLPQVEGAPAKTQSNANERNDPTPLPSSPAPVPMLVHPVTNPAYRIVTQGWGERPDYYSRFAVDGVPLKGHNGLDFGTPLGTVIAAVDGGRVVEVADDPEGYGLYVKLSHAWGESLYAHLRDQLVQVGEWANKGQFVGKSGSTGNSTAPHLHFGLRVAPFNRKDGWGGFTDPSPYLKTDAAPLPRLTNDHLLTLIKAAAQEFGLEWQLVASLAWAESSWNPRATSKVGARGLLQLMPDTWNEWRDKVGGTDIFDPAQNLRVGSAYLAWLISYLKGDVYKALLAYNMGIGNVNMGLTPPQGTIAYVERVLFGRDLLKAVGA